MFRVASFVLIITAFLFCKNGNSSNAKTFTQDSLVKLEMHLSAFGVESDDFPSVDADIDFTTKTSQCKKWYYTPQNKPIMYQLSSAEIAKIDTILSTLNFDQLKLNYSTNKSDQPTSKMVIFTRKRKIELTDYGLEAPQPIQDIYRLVYKLNH